MGKKRFETILLRNTIAITLPAMAAFIVLIFMFIKYPVFDKVKCYTIGNIENVGGRLSEMYEDGEMNVSYEAENLFYTGFNYYVNGKIKGAYYYTMHDDQLLFFVIKTEDLKISIPKENIRGRIVKDTIAVEHIVNQLSQEFNMSGEMLTGYYSEYVINEPDYPVLYIVIMCIISYIPIGAVAFIFIYIFVIWTRPKWHPQSRQLAVYGDVQTIIEELNSQLRYPLFKRNNVWITTDYMVVSYVSKTDIIKLDFIKYLSKNLVEADVSLRKKQEVYRITMSNPDKIFYEVDFTNEEFADQVISYIRGIKK